MDGLINDFEKSIFDESAEVVGEYIELGIDSLLNEADLKEIPIVNTIVGVLKVGKNVHDRNLLKQTLIFINEFNTNRINKDKLEEYKERIENNPKKSEKELGRVLLLLNNFIDQEKSIILAKLFKSYINEKINWNEFCEYSEITNRMFIQDLKLLKLIYEKKIIDYEKGNNFRVERLQAIGVVGINPKSLFSFGEQEIKENRVSINGIGKRYVEIIFNS